MATATLTAGAKIRVVEPWMSAAEEFSERGKNTDGELNNFLNGFESALDDMNAHINGRKNLKSAWELANEL